MKTNKMLLIAIVLITTSVNLFSQTTAEEWKKLGNVELDSANYHKAIEYYQKAIEVDSNYFAAYYNLGLAFYNISDYDKAIEYFNKAITKNDTDADAFSALGSIYLEKQDYHKAIEYYQKAIEVDSNYFDAYYNLGSIFFFISDYDKAIEYFTKAITKDDTDASCFFALGNIYAEKQDYDKAIEMFKEGIKIEPNLPEKYYYLGFLYYEKGNFAYANMYFKKAAQLGDTLAQQYFTDNKISWEDNFEKPDYDRIKLNIENKKSNFYYAKLWDRYQQGDSTMTIEEKRHLYYGYVFNKNYSPYLSAHDANKVNAILNKEKPTEKEWKELVSLLNISLSVEPFHCRFLYYQSVAYNALNKSVEADKNMIKIWSIIDALSSTGYGLTKETAMHVIAVSSEYDYLFFNDLSMRTQSLVNGGYDVLYLNPNDDGIEEMWFDVNQPYNHLGKSSK